MISSSFWPANCVKYCRVILAIVRPAVKVLPLMPPMLFCPFRTAVTCCENYVLWYRKEGWIVHIPKLVFNSKSGRVQRFYRDRDRKSIEPEKRLSMRCHIMAVLIPADVHTRCCDLVNWTSSASHLCVSTSAASQEDSKPVRWLRLGRKIERAVCLSKKPFRGWNITLFHPDQWMKQPQKWKAEGGRKVEGGLNLYPFFWLVVTKCTTAIQKFQSKPVKQWPPRQQLWRLDQYSRTRQLI